MTTPTLEQKIEAEFEKYFSEELLRAPSEDLKEEFIGLKSVLYFPFKAAALPLHKRLAEAENLILRMAYAVDGEEKYTATMIEMIRTVEAREYLEKFKLDEVKA